MGHTLELVLILLASAVFVVVLFRWLHLPPLLGYLLVGVAVGPFALAWIPDTDEGRRLAEFGVVFLMFSIGLEFSLPKLFQLRRAVFGLGFAQVLLTLGAVLAAASLAGAPWQAAVAVGGAIAMSSTAMVLRMLTERIQLETPHGRDIVGVLLFQDLAVVPLLILIPAMAEGGGGELAQRLAFALAKATVVLVVLKFILVAGLARLFGAGPGAAVRTGLALAQVGEFGLVLMVLAQSVALLDRAFSELVVAAMLLSMLAAPFLIQASDKLALRWSSAEWMLQSLALHRVAAQSLATERHVVVCGYGRTGQRLAHMLEQEHIAFIALDTDPERVRGAAAAGEKVVFGDASRHETLVAAGVARASALVITFADTRLALRILHHVRALNPALPAIVRTLDDADMDRLIAAGASERVPETFESSLMLASHALVLLGVPLRRVVRRIREVREHRYSLMRGFFHGGTDEAEDPDEAREPRLHSATHAAGVR